MYLLNTSFIVEPDVHTRWLDIMTTKYIPFLKEKGFEINTFSRVISVEPVEHLTYSLLVEIQHMGHYQMFTDDIFSEYLAICEPLFGAKTMWFNSLLKKIDIR